MKLHISTVVFILQLSGLREGVNAEERGPGTRLDASSTPLELYTQNSICRQNNCINPLFPALNDMPRLEEKVWQCTSHSVVAKYMEFCKDAVVYDPALQSPNSTSVEIRELVKQQDDAASTMFVYHLNGMGYEAWEHQEPHNSDDPCIRSIWKMVCYTYFPKIEAGCTTGQGTPYRRPCMDTCDSYLKSCAVECCDESAACVFEHSMKITEGVSVLQTGYVDAVGPSAICTGSGSLQLRAPVLLLLAILGIHLADDMPASSSSKASKRTSRVNLKQFTVKHLVGVGVLIGCMCLLHGCDVDVPHHTVGNWRKQPDYLVEFAFVEPGQPPTEAKLNSCALKDVADAVQCNGHGYCKQWNANTKSMDPVSFCKCELGWADPECRTQRKSQVVVFLFSLLGGFLGLDYFYLGYPCWGILKLGTLGGCGFWWLVDIIRTGSGPVYARDFRVANNLPHWVFVLTVVMLFSAIGFFVSIESYLVHRRKKREDVMRLHESEEAHQSLRKPDEYEGARYRFGPGNQSFEGRHAFSGYGSTLPMPHPNADAPYAVPPAHGQPGRFAGPYGPAGIPPNSGF